MAGTLARLRLLCHLAGERVSAKNLQQTFPPPLASPPRAHVSQPPLGAHEGPGQHCHVPTGIGQCLHLEALTASVGRRMCLQGVPSGAQGSQLKGWLCWVPGSGEAVTWVWRTSSEPVAAGPGRPGSLRCMVGPLVVGGRGPGATREPTLCLQRL